MQKLAPLLPLPFDPFDRSNAWNPPMKRKQPPVTVTDDNPDPRLTELPADIVEFVRRTAKRKNSTTLETLRRMLGLVKSRFESLDRYEASSRCDLCGKTPTARGPNRCRCTLAELAAMVASRPRSMY